MQTPKASLDRRGGLANVIDIVIAPNAAFARLHEAPVWGWALLVASLLGILGALLAQPAIIHGLERSLPAQFAASPQIAALPPEKQQTAIANALAVTKAITQFSWIGTPIIILIIGLIQGLIMLIANAITRSEGTFKRFFALSITVTIVGIGISSVIVGLIAELRGAGSFDDPAAVAALSPGLVMLVPGAHGKLQAFLSVLNVFAFWSTALLALGMIGVAKMPRVAAWATAIIMLLFVASLQALFAQQH